MDSEFRNLPLIDFSQPDNRNAMQQALDKVASEFGKEYPVLIASDELRSDNKLTSYNPSEGDEVVGVFQQATPEMVEQAIAVAAETFVSWSRRSAEERADYCFRTAEVMRNRRMELSAWMVYEEGKSWVEADADVAEAIDFLEFYGREAIRYAQPQPLTPIAGEKNELRYIPLGVGAVIPPWNFPLAILVGMTSAAFVSGNTVVLKPSSDSPTIGQKFVEVLREIDLPPGVVNYVTGGGGRIGDTLVGHPLTRFISFTGSKEVGLHIVELAAKTAPGQKWIKRVVAEMGGKDSIVVADDADLDAAAQGIVASAFGFQGQKCSACSRAIIDRKVYDKTVEKIVALTEKITVGPVRDRANYMGPVINQRAMESILGYIETGKKEGKVVTGGHRLDRPGYFIQPTVIADVDPMAVISQEEIFGPVLAIIRADDFDHALEIANNTEYGLTGALYSKDWSKIERAKDEFHVGNLYFNRKCTGALVGGHPFGGFNMSGTDSKAGGRDYLLLFMQAKAMSEKV
jgi:1-pyrroline-5-carboxylate dehydrogenase